MKKFFILSTLLVISIFNDVQAQFKLTDSESTVVYSLPKTELCIEVQTEKVTQKQGMFYRYSERYLATNKVITEEKSNYKLKSIVVKTRAIPDPSRTYTLGYCKSTEMAHISVDKQGLLCGINVPMDMDEKTPMVATLSTTESVQKQSLLPLGEEYMMAGSEAKLAEGAAKQIYRIRERRLSLLTADVEKLPADGVSYKSMLEGMNNLERELTELFVGKITTETQTKTIYLTPDSTTNNQVVFRMSTLKGLVPADDLSGVPYYINVKPTYISTIAADPKAKIEKVILYSILPATTQISIGDGVNTYCSGQFYIPQFGKTVPVSENMLMQKNLKIQIDKQTGRILNIEQ